MYQTCRLNKDLNVTYQSNISEYLNPNYICLHGSLIDDLTQGSPVYKDSIVTKDPVCFSSVSGSLYAVKEKLIVIKNDFMENYEAPKRASKYAKYTDQIIFKLLQTYHFSNPQIIEELAKSPHTILINGIDDVPYVNTRTYLLNNLSEIILETCEILNTTLKPDEFILALKNTDTETIAFYNDHVGSFPFIQYRYLNDEYPLGYKEILCNKLSLEEANTVLITIEELLEINEIIKRLRPLSEIYLSIIIPGEKSFILKTKLYTSLNDIITEFNLPKDQVYYLNNLLLKQTIDPFNYLIDNTTKALYILPPQEDKPLPCINCGICYTSCPFQINPLDPEEIKKCRHCGLCTYNCPAHISLGGDFRAQ